MMSLVVRILANSTPEPNSGCWLWTGHAKPNGYGTLGIKRDGRWFTAHAHRVSYEQFVGVIPAGTDLDHKCRLRCCVNPDHLEAVTRSVNLRRSPLMSRQESKDTCPRGHKYSGSNSRGQRICAICAADATKRYRNRRKV